MYDCTFFCISRFNTCRMQRGKRRADFHDAACSAANAEPISTTAILFDTVISIELYGTKDTSILDDCISMCQDYEDRFSRTIDTSEIAQINNAHGAAVTVSDDTIELIQKGLDYGRLSNGYFDITIAPLSSLWDFKNNTGVVPDASAIEEAKSHVNYQNVIINGNTVTLTDPKAAIDLGGIAKGYIADQLKALIEAKDVKHGIISLGGNVLTIGNSKTIRRKHCNYKCRCQGQIRCVFRCV